MNIKELDSTNLTSVFVAGDFLKDYNIIKYPVALTSYRDDLPSTVMTAGAGGAWYLAELIKFSLSGYPQAVIAPDYDLIKDSTGYKLHNAYQIWSKFDDKAGKGKKEEKKPTWRIDKFLGCEKSMSELPLPFPTGSEELITKIVVIEDLGLGFAEDKTAINNLTEKMEQASGIILKTHSKHFNSHLWKTLEGKNLLKKTTVVITVELLRDGGALIPRGFSWDQTIEETARELNSGHFSFIFKNCKRVIVLFDKFGICSFTTGGLKFGPEKEMQCNLTFEKFVYDNRSCEGAFDNKNEGNIYGALSILTAAVTLFEYSQKVALSYIFSITLNAIHKSIELGGGTGNVPVFDDINEYLKTLFSLHLIDEKKLSKEKEKEHKKFKESIRKFYSSYPEYYESAGYGLKKVEGKYISNILADLAGTGENFLYAKAVEIILTGTNKGLAQVPMASFGNYQTFDREEIERINSVRNLISTYIKRQSDSRPLSFAVFGAPGSGKSFAIKQLLESIFGSSNKPLVFNLTQFNKDIKNLYQAFHSVRDSTVKGNLPLVFWDEFDADNGDWLKEFLAPMQDGEFVEGSQAHPLGRAIFVFAGGTSSTFEQYEKETLPKKALKGPDFISRLRGFVNIKGPNKTVDKEDPAYLIRRAVLILSMLNRHHKQIFDKNKIPAISPGVLNALLKTSEYLHGARSMESIITLSSTSPNNQFNPSSLPAPELLKIHTNSDFSGLVHQGELEYHLVEILAETIHDYWKTEKERQGYKLGTERKDGPDIFTHQRILPYNQLQENWKEDNRKPARLTKSKFEKIGYIIIPPHEQHADDVSFEYVIKSHLNDLIKAEHDIWLRDRLIEGYEFAATSDDKALLHKDIADLKDITDSKEIDLDKAIIYATQTVLDNLGYKLRKIIN